MCVFFNQAEVLRLGGADVQLTYLELLDNNIGPKGANALGQSLSYGHNLSLMTLKLDYNSTLGVEGKKFPMISSIKLCSFLLTTSYFHQWLLNFYHYIHHL